MKAQFDSRIAAASCAAALAGLAGCAAVPKIEYTQIDQASPIPADAIDSFFLQASRITLDRREAPAPAPAGTPGAVTATSVPLESADMKFMLRRADSFGVRTNLNLTKWPNTDLVKEVGSEVIDNRVDTITRIGQAAVALTTAFVARVTPSGPDLDLDALPIVFDDPAKQLADPLNGGDVKDPGSGVTIRIKPLPPDARPVASLASPVVLRGLIYSACRTATVMFSVAGKPHSVEVKISDPRFYQQVAFPLKGKISMHAECGVSVLSEKDAGVASNAAVFQALAEQAKAVREAVESRHAKPAGSQ